MVSRVQPSNPSERSSLSLPMGRVLQSCLEISSLVKWCAMTTASQSSKTPKARHSSARRCWRSTSWHIARRVPRSFAQQPALIACSIHSSFSHGKIENLRFFTRAKKNWRKRKGVKHMWLYSSGFLGKAVVTKCAKEGEAYELSGCHFGRWSKCFCSLMDINIEGEILPSFLAWTPTNIWKKPSSMGSNEVTIRQLVLQKGNR